jgi:hypothetical protein
MKNKNKMRKQMQRMEKSEQVSNPAREAMIDKIMASIDTENIEEMDKLADKLGIIRLSDYMRMQDEEDRRNGVPSCDCCECRARYPNYS